MANTDEYLKIGIAAEADVSGFRETQEAAEETQRTVTETAVAPRAEQEQQAAAVKAVTDALREQAQAAAEAQSSAGAGQTGGNGSAGDAAANAQVAAAAERAAEANRKAARAAEEAAEAERMLRREMELASKTRLQLSQELGQLEKAMRAAAKAGDTAAYQRLRGEMAEVKGAYEKVQSGCEMANVALTQQAQVGLQAGQTMAAIGQAAAGGAGNVAGMASQVISLGAAFKAGLGPIGWAMAALQGLQVAWDYFTQRQEKARKAMEESERAAQSVRDEVARQESDWAELQRGSLAEKRRWLEAEIAGMREGSERRLEYERRLQQVNEEIAAARVHELSSIEASRSYAVRDERSAQERMDADEQILIAKRETLRAELAAGENLTPVLRMNLGRQIAAVERQLEGLAQARLDEVSREAAEELRGIGTELRASRSYAGEVKRSEAEQLAADREILLAKRERLRALAGMPGLNEATLRGVNAALAETEREIDGLAARMAENAAAAGRWLREMEPPQLQARNSMLQRQLDALARGYAAAAKRAGEAAGRGDTQSLRQAERAAANYARNMNRLSRDSSAGTRLHERTRAELQKMVTAARSATRAQQQSNREAQRKSRADKQAADAAQKVAREAQQRPAEAHAEGLQKFAEATARLEELERKVAEGIRNATAGVEKVAGATEGTLAAVEQLAGALAEMQQQTESRLKEIEKAISMLKKK